MFLKKYLWFRDFAVKRLEFAGFTSCEYFRCYCGPILRGVKGMEKKKNLVFVFIFWFFFQYWLVNKLMYRERTRQRFCVMLFYGWCYFSILRDVFFLYCVMLFSSLFFPWFLLLPFFFIIKIILSLNLENSTRSI